MLHFTYICNNSLISKYTLQYAYHYSIQCPKPFHKSIYLRYQTTVCHELQCYYCTFKLFCFHRTELFNLEKQRLDIVLLGLLSIEVSDQTFVCISNVMLEFLFPTFYFGSLRDTLATKSTAALPELPSSISRTHNCPYDNSWVI